MNVSVWDVKLTEVLSEKTEKRRYLTALIEAEILFFLSVTHALWAYNTGFYFLTAL